MKKICIVTTSLSSGGAERFSADLTFILEKIGFEVHILLTKDKVDYSYTGVLFNLQKQLKNHNGGLHKIWLLKRYFKKNKFDYIIDNRTRNRFLKELIMYKYMFNRSKVIGIVHSYYLKNYFPKNTIFTKVLYGNIYKIVAVSNEIKNKIDEKFKLKNVVHIYNSLNFDKINHAPETPIEFHGSFILAYGRIDEKVKNYSLLLHAYKKSGLSKKGIKLIILGDGKDLNYLKALSIELLISENVIFLGFTINPFPYVKRAMFTVLTSRNEGFPMVLIESLACNTPVVSVNCKSGPEEIIVNKYNGLIVKNHDYNALANALNMFANDKELYLHCKKNARNSIKHLDVATISSKWEDLLNSSDID